MTITPNEFTLNVRAEGVGATPYDLSFEADERTRDRLAKRFAILSVDSLRGKGTLTRQADGFTIHLQGTLEATVHQACVATLEPVEEHIKEPFQAYFLDESHVTSFAKAKKKKEQDIDPMLLEDLDEQPIPEDHEDPEQVVGGMIDVGEIVAQHLALALNPYPRSEKELPKAVTPEEKPEKPVSPFAVLKDLLTK